MIRLISDSSTIYSIEEGKALPCDITPLCVTINGKTYREFEEIDAETFLGLIKAGYIPSSSQPSMGELVELFEKYPDDVKAIAAAGHDLGNHSENHKQMSQLSAEQCKEELLKPHEKVKALTGKEMILFRPPYGDYNDNLIRVCREINYYPIQWDVDSLDWKDYDADTIVRRVTEHKHLGNGSIILCHNGAKHTAEALDTMIKTLKEKGYEFVPISELILKDNYEIDTEGRQHKAG